MNKTDIKIEDQQDRGRQNLDGAPKQKDVSATLQANECIKEEGEYLDKYHREKRIREQLYKHFSDEYKGDIKNATITRDEDNYIFVQDIGFNHIFKQDESGELTEIEFFKKYNSENRQISMMEEKGKYFLVNIIETHKNGESNKNRNTYYLIDKDGKIAFSEAAKEIPYNFFYNKKLQLYRYIQTTQEEYPGQKKITQTFYDKDMKVITEVKLDPINYESGYKYSIEYYQNNKLIISKYDPDNCSKNDPNQRYYQIFQNGNKIREGNLETVKNDQIFQEWEQEQKRKKEKNKTEKTPSVEEQIESNTGCTIEYSDDQKTAKLKKKDGSVLYEIDNITQTKEEPNNNQIEFYRKDKHSITIEFATDSPILQIKTSEEVKRNGQVQNTRKDILINTKTGKQAEYLNYRVERIGKFFRCYINGSQAEILNEDLKSIGKNAYFTRDKPIIYRDGKRYLVAPRTGLELTEFIGDPKQTYKDKDKNVVYYIVDIPHGQDKTKEVQVEVELAY